MINHPTTVSLLHGFFSTSLPDVEPLAVGVDPI